MCKVQDYLLHYLPTVDHTDRELKMAHNDRGPKFYQDTEECHEALVTARVCVGGSWISRTSVQDPKK